MSNRRKEWKGRRAQENTADSREDSTQQRNQAVYSSTDSPQNSKGQSRYKSHKRPRSSSDENRPHQHSNSLPQRPQHWQSQKNQPRQHHNQQSHYRPHYPSQSLQNSYRSRSIQHGGREEASRNLSVIKNVVAVSSPEASSTLSPPPQSPAVREIPGFYYDPEKKKYFKITANHTLGGSFAFSQQSIKEKTAKKPTLEAIKSKRTSIRFPSSTTQYGRLDWFLQDQQLGLAGNPRRQLCQFHALIVKQWRRCRRVEPVLVEDGAVYTHLQVDSERQDLYVSTIRGELWRHHFSSNPLETHSQWMQLDSRETSELTSLHVTSDQYLVTTHLGNMSRSGVLKVQKSFSDASPGSITSESGPWHVVLEHSPKKSNVWTSSYAANRISIGADKAIIALQDWKSGRPMVTSLWTGSDVFSIAMESPLGRGHNLLYAGCRNGHVKIFDLSQPNVAALAMAEAKKNKRSKTASLFRGIGHKDSSVLGMKRVGDHYLVTSAMNGEILMWDTRFVGNMFANPVMDIRGPIQDQFSKTLFDINGEETLLAAENIDNNISLWSLSSGDRIRDLEVKGKVGCLQFSSGKQGIWTAVEGQVQFWGLDP